MVTFNEFKLEICSVQTFQQLYKTTEEVILIIIIGIIPYDPCYLCTYSTTSMYYAFIIMQKYKKSQKNNHYLIFLILFHPITFAEILKKVLNL